MVKNRGQGRGNNGRRLEEIGARGQNEGVRPRAARKLPRPLGVTTEGWGSAGAWPERKREVALRLFSRRIRGNYLAETGDTQIPYLRIWGC